MRRVAILLALSSCFAGCRTTAKPDPNVNPDAESPAEGDEPLPPPVRPRPEDAATVWDFMQRKYDDDGDGRVTRSEYDRGESQFARFDRDKSGAITAEDFGPGGNVSTLRQASPERRHAMMAQRALMRFFHEDDDRNELTIEEVRARFATFDGDRDGTVTLVEFQVVVTLKMSGKIYESLLFVVDTDKSGALSLAELESYFGSRDKDGDGKWTSRSRRGGGGRRADSGIAVGQPAFDFTLKPPHGGAAVTLSGFVGDRPVALIFGSYT